MAVTLESFDVLGLIESSRRHGGERLCDPSSHNTSYDTTQELGLFRNLDSGSFTKDSVATFRKNSRDWICNEATFRQESSSSRS